MDAKRQRAEEKTGPTGADRSSPLVTVRLIDSDEGLAAQAELLDRWLGHEIAALFGVLG